VQAFQTSYNGVPARFRSNSHVLPTGKVTLPFGSRHAGSGDVISEGVISPLADSFPPPIFCAAM